MAVQKQGVGLPRSIFHSSPRPRAACMTRSPSRACMQCSSTSSNSSSSGDKPGKRRKGRAKLPGLFEISVVSPPPRSLGIYALPPLTHNGEMIEVEGSGYVVTSVVIQFKLKGNKYVREHNRLEVLPTGRWLLNQQLESLLQAKYIGPPPGPNTQD